MTERLFRGLALLLASLSLAACASPASTRFYTLLPATAELQTPQVGARAFELMPVRVPSQVDVPQLLVRRSDGELGVLETHQWVSPLPEELRLALSAGLTAALGQQDLYGIARPDDLPVQRIQIELRRFEVRPGAAAQLQALWAVRPAGEGDPLSCAGGFQAAVSDTGVAGLVAAYQAALQDLVQAIADSAHSARC